MAHSLTRTFYFVGDVQLGRLFNRLPQFCGPAEKTLNPFDLQLPSPLFGNLECVITSNTSRAYGKVFEFNMLPEHAGWLKPFRFLSTTNNHSNDYYGATETRSRLGSLEIATTSGRDLTNIDDVGFLCASDHPKEWAGPNFWYLPVTTELSRDVKRLIVDAKKQCEWLVMSYHWNANWVPEVTDSYRKFAHALIDAGVDFLWGHSPHHLLPLEHYRGGLIAYSVGDFIDDYAIDENYRSDLGCILQVKFGETTESVGSRITQIHKLQVSDASGEDRKEGERRLGILQPLDRTEPSNTGKGEK